MADWLTQEDHLLQLTTPLGKDVLALTELIFEEGVSKVFNGDLTMISGETNISPEKVIGKAFSIKLRSGDQPRYFHGQVHHFRAGEIENGLRTYHAKIVPFLHFLDYTSDCRIFQNKSVIDIAYAILGEFGFSNFMDNRTTRAYPAREYCVQYRETALNFLNRLFEEEGIFYFFEHEKDKHTLVLADKNATCKMGEAQACFQKGAYRSVGLKHFHRHNAFYSGKYEQTDFNFEMPSTSLHTQQPGSAKLPMAQKYGLYDYPGRYHSTDKGKNLTTQHFESREMAYDQYAGDSNYTSFSAGTSFNLLEAPIQSDAGEYILTHVLHHVVDTSYLGSYGGEHQSQHYENSFSCVPKDNTIRMPTRHPKPLISGPQTAMVVGPEGSEISTDNYGRVTVQFHWDRKGKYNEYSSCAVRVAQVWAGKNWGAVFIPRIGHEVIVHFIDGDPDRPIITGSVYNADNPMPYEYPFDETKSGIKSHSSKGGGDADANELYFEDKMGSEEIYLHAQKDFNQVVKNNMNIQIAKDGAVQSDTLEISAKTSIKLSVGGNVILINDQGVSINGAHVKIQE